MFKDPVGKLIADGGKQPVGKTGRRDRQKDGVNTVDNLEDHGCSRNALQKEPRIYAGNGGRTS